MQFDYKHIVKDLKFKVTGGYDNVFERQYGISYKMIELEGNNYALGFDQISREVSLYKGYDFVRKIETLKELHEWVAIIKFDRRKGVESIVSSISKLAGLASSDIPIEILMQIKKATDELTERFITNK